MMKTKKTTQKNQYKKEYEKINDERANFFKKGTVGLLDLIMPDGIVEGKDYLYFGPQKYVRVYALMGYPRNLTIGALNDYFSLGGIDINTYIEPIPDNSVIKRLTSKFSMFMSNMNLQVKRGSIIDYGLKHAAEDIDELREDIQTNSEKMFYAQPIVFVWSQNLSELSDKCEMFESICSRKSIVAKALVCDQLKGFLTGMPFMDIKYSECLRNMTTGSIACFIPTGNTELSHKSGIYYGENLFTKSPIFYNEFIGAPTLTNPHTFVFGTSGAGKSVFLKLKGNRTAATGKWVIIFDPQGEYKKLIDKNGGQYITLKAGVKSGINPFELEIEENEFGEKQIDLYGKRSEIIEMLSIFSEKFRGRPLLGQEITAVDSVVEELYKHKGITTEPESLYEKQEEEIDGKFYTGKVKKELPILSDVRNGLIKYNENVNSDDISEFAEVMKIITGNGPMAMFDCQTTINLDKRLVAISFKDLSDDFSKFYATVNVMSWVWSKFSNWKFKDMEKEVIIDEGSLFAKFERSMYFIELIARLGRKFHIALTLATQFIQDFLGSKSGEAIINLCATKIILKQEPNIAKKVSEFFMLSSRCTQLISSFVSGQAILLAEQELVVMQVKPFDFEWDYVRT